MRLMLTYFSYIYTLVCIPYTCRIVVTSFRRILFPFVSLFVLGEFLCHCKRAHTHIRRKNFHFHTIFAVWNQLKCKFSKYTHSHNFRTWCHSVSFVFALSVFYYTWIWLRYVSLFLFAAWCLIWFDSLFVRLFSLRLSKLFYLKTLSTIYTNTYISSNL